MRYREPMVRQIPGVLLLVALVLSSTPALANHRAPANGPTRTYGEVVDYAMTFPVVGDNRYSSGFWSRRGSGTHHAVDVMAAKMTPVVAVADGVIARYNGRSHPNSTYRGRCCTLSIKHDDGWQSTYIHLNNDTPGTDDGQGWGIASGLALGSRVKAGQVIGWVGDSGNAEATSPHLHFELQDPDGVYVDPYESLRAAESAVAVTVTGTACPASASVDLHNLINGAGLLRSGNRGQAVTQLQTFLGAVGYDPGGIDGVMGHLTVGALRSFQEGRGINLDGVVGPVTREHIAEVAEVLPSIPVLDAQGRIIRPGYRGDDVKRLQEVLGIIGFDPGAADGVYGPKTQSAVSAFQRAHSSLVVDGKLGPNTRSALIEHLGLGSVRACS